MNNLKVGILGANGFIGKALVNKLEKNTKVCELHLYSRSIYASKYNNLATFLHQFELKNENNKIPESLFQVDILYYLLSDSIPASSWENPTDEVMRNLVPFLNLIEKLKEGKLKKIIFTSSAGTIYGPSLTKISEESHKHPFSPHGISKLTTEYFLDYFRIKYNIFYDIFRISNIYGPGQNTSKGLGLINTIIEKHNKGKEITIYGDGSAIRNYIYIKDVAEILSLALENEIDKSSILNLASSDNLSIKQILQIIEEIINEKIKIKYENSRTSDNPFILIDNSKLLNEYPTFATTPIEIGIQETIKSIFTQK
jgi:UDP-glucose 4-epimerase